MTEIQLPDCRGTVSRQRPLAPLTWLRVGGPAEVLFQPADIQDLSAFLAALDGSCETPIAGLAELDGPTLRFRGEILRTDGSEALAGERSGSIADGPEMGRDLAAELLAKAGDGFFDWKV